MTYKEKFVAVIKSNGKILRESGNEVRIPFGSEYEIYMKNLNTKKAVVEVSVDGQDVLDGNSLVLRPNETTTLRGFMKDTAVKNRFRFIEKTKEISDYRGDRIDDGIVSVRFQFEQDAPFIAPPPKPWPDWDEYDWTEVERKFRRKSKGISHQFLSDSSTTGPTFSNFTYNTTYTCSTPVSSNSSMPKTEEGITVKGSETHQQFYRTSVGALEPVSEVIILRLVGTTSKGKRIRKPVTTKTKVRCPTCGRRWKSSMKYCGNCSTYLR